MWANRGMGYPPSDEAVATSNTCEMWGVVDPVVDYVGGYPPLVVTLAGSN